MDWSNERFVRVYTRDSRNWRVMGWEARCVLVMLMRRVDRSGILELGANWQIADLAEEIGMPAEIAQIGLAKLEGMATVTRTNQPSPGVTISNFLAAQETRQSDAARQRASRESRRAHAIGVTAATDVTNGHHLSPSVTICHQEEELSAQPPALAAGSGNGVTNCHQLSPYPSEPSVPSSFFARAGSGPGPATRLGVKPTSIRSTPEGAGRRCKKCRKIATSMVESQEGAICVACYFPQEDDQ